MNHGDIRNLILHTIEQWYATRYVEKHGLVTAYDPNKHLGKVKLMPEGQETGWLPIETGLIGQNYGIVIGLQPGSGGSQTGTSASTFGGSTRGIGQQQSGNQGDQVMVRLQEGDIEAGKISLRLHSSQDTPPAAQSGEMIFWTKFQKSGGPTPDAGSGGQGGNGQQIRFTNDGKLTKTDGNGATIVLDGKGNIQVTAQNPGTTITNQIASGGTPGGGILGGGGLGDIGSQLSGLIGQASGLASAGVGLPGLNNIGTQILGVASTATSGTGSRFTSQIANLATQMASGLTSMSSMSGLVSGMMSQLSGLLSSLNPLDMLSQAMHMHVLDQVKGIITSAFQGQHTTTWNQQGITHTSTTKVTSTAPIIPHNGNTLVSDLLQVAKNIISGTGFFGPVFSIFSDARLKTNVQPIGPVLDKVRRLRVSTFHKKFVSHDDQGKLLVLNDGEDTLGLIAQEARQVLPEIVRGDENTEFLSVDGDKVAMIAIAALQELAIEVETLKQQLAKR